jgi:tripartite-type tricarboxylate transporter receptor subunit TctC
MLNSPLIMRSIFRMRSIFVLALTFSTSAYSKVPTVEQFYKDHQITLISSSGAGGGYDVYSRLLAQYIVKYIPGHPRIIVENMPGADGIMAINYSANAAPRDGSVIFDAFSTMPIYPLVDGRNAKFDPRQINWIGSISQQVSVCIAWKTSSFKTFGDVFKRTMRVAGTGATGWRSVLPHLYNLVAGSKFEVVTGYATGADYLAVENGEVDGTCTTYDTLSATKSSWIKQKDIRFLAQFSEKPLPQLPDTPLALPMIHDKVGRSAFELILSQEETGRPYLAPPGVPADRLAAIRNAFDETMKDPEFIAAAEREHLSLKPMNARQMEQLIDGAYSTPQAIVDRARSLILEALPR